MTTTTKHTDRIIALRDKARATDFPAEAETYLEKARELCAKHGIDPSILDAKPETKAARGPIHDGSRPQNDRRYPCRFGCGTWTMHTIDELNACAEKARNATATGNAYDAPKTGNPFGGSANWNWNDFVNDFNDSTRSRRSDHTDSSYTDSRGRTRTHQARANGSHAFCDHEATKSARAKCRKERGY